MRVYMYVYMRRMCAMRICMYGMYVIQCNGICCDVCMHACGVCNVMSLFTQVVYVCMSYIYVCMYVCMHVCMDACVRVL